MKEYLIKLNEKDIRLLKYCLNLVEEEFKTKKKNKKNIVYNEIVETLYKEIHNDIVNLSNKVDISLL